MVYGLAVWPHLWDVVCSIAVTNMVLLLMTLRVSTKSIDKYFLQNVGHGTVDIARMLLELIFKRRVTVCMSTCRVLRMTYCF